MAKFVINKKYLPKERAGAGQLFIILSRTAKAEDIEAADEVLKVLSARFPFATLINSSLLDASPLEGQSETEQQSWLDSIQPVWLNFIRQQQSEFQVADAATA